MVDPLIKLLFTTQVIKIFGGQACGQAVQRLHSGQPSRIPGRMSFSEDLDLAVVADPALDAMLELPVNSIPKKMTLT
jgi:hypothetical protein